jgi:hypothetical protein
MKNGLFAFPVLMVFLVLTNGCKKASFEDEIKAIVKDAAIAAEAKDMKKVMGLISKDYKDSEGNDRDAVKGILFYHFMRGGDISVFITSIDAEASADSAVAEARAVLVMGKKIREIKDIVPEEAAGYGFTIFFKREDGDWKVRSAEWRNVGLAGLL